MQIFRFKQAQHTDLTKITNLNKLTNETQKQVNQANQLRIEILNFDQEEVLQGNIEKGNQLELIYLKYLYILDDLVETNIQDMTQVVFKWNDSYNPVNFINGSQWHYEYACTLYNLSILYYYLSNHVKNIRDALQRSRNGIWALCKLQQILPFVQTNILCMHADLGYAHIRMLYSYNYAFGYKALYDNFSLKEVQGQAEQISIFLIEAYQCYKSAIQQLSAHQSGTSKKLPPIVYNQLLELLSTEFATSKVTVSIRLAKFHAAQAVEDPKKQHMGLALGYLVVCERVNTNLQKLTKKKCEVLVNLMESVPQLKQELENKNKQIYKQKVASEEMLFQYIIEDKNKITYKLPEIFQQKQEEKNQLEKQKNKSVQELIIKVNQRKQQVQSTYQEIENSLHEIYEDFHLQKMIDANSIVNQFELPTSLRKNVEFIKSRGGLKGSQQEVQEIMKTAQHAGQQSIGLRTKLQNEQLEDEKMRQTYGNKWTALRSEQLNQTYRRKIENMSKQLAQASQINKQTQDQIAKYNIYLELALGQEDLIMSRMSGSMIVSAQYQKKNTQQLKRLVIYYENMKNQIIQIQIRLEKILKYIDDLQLDKAHIQIMDEFLQKKIIDVLDEQISDFESNCKAIDFEKIKQQAIPLQDQHLSVLIDQGEDEIEQGFRIICDQFINLDYAKSFYNQIQQQLNQISIEVDDFICARNLERSQFQQ